MDSFILQGKPLTALCWGHNDMRLFVAAGHNMYVTWVIKHVPKLQYLCQRSVQRAVKNSRNVERLPLPSKLNENVQALFSPTIKVNMFVVLNLRGIDILSRETTCQNCFASFLGRGLF